MKRLVIIGAGPGGYEVAIEASKEELEVVIIDKAELGGTCLNVGCIPTKTLYKSAEVIKNIKNGEKFGVNGDFTLDMEQVIANKNEVVASLKKGIQFLLDKGNVQFIQGEAKFISKDEVEVNGETIKGDYFLVATGSVPRMLNIPGVDSDIVVTSTEMLDLTEVPKRLTVIGGGVVGVELASIYNKFGSEVTIVEYEKNLLSMFDDDVAKRIKPALKKQGINIITNAACTEIRGNEVVYELKGKEAIVEADLVLMSTGRAPYYDNLGLDTIGIEYDRGGIKVDKNFKTNVENIYAVGDCIGGMMLAHTATYQSYNVLDQIMGRNNTTDFNMVPACVFTFPEIASIGMTKAEAKEKFEDIEVVKSMYAANGKALSMGEDGFLSLIIASDKIVGASVFGYSASTIIHEIALIIGSEKSVSSFKDVIFAHPTLSEILAHAIRH